MKAQGVQPTAVTYGCMMNGYDAAGRVDGAFKLYQEASFMTPALQEIWRGKLSIITYVLWPAL
jgi:pentatricopeptide repeat protein